MKVKEGNKVLLFIRNLIIDKLNTSYVGVFRVKEVREITILLKLSDIKIYLQFYILLLKKISSNTL